MENYKKKAKKYCAVFNCLNTDRNPNLTFFTLPKDSERRRKWLRLIDRQDLLQKVVTKRTSYSVCSAHFEDSSIKITRYLKENALPSILLPNQPQEGSSCSETQSTSSQVIDNVSVTILSNKIEKKCSCSSELQSTSARTKGRVKVKTIILSNSTEYKEYATAGTQTESFQSTEKQTSTSKSLTAETPRKRKLLNEIRGSNLKRRKLDQEITKIKKQLEAKN